MTSRQQHSIAVFPCGSEIGLEIAKCFQEIKDAHLVGISSFADHGRFVFDDYVEIQQFVDDDDFIDCFNRTITNHKIDLVFPAHDSALLKLGENAGSLRADIIGSAPSTIAITRSKRQTYNHFRHLIRVPTEYEYHTKLEYPLFVKPDRGQGSKGCYVVRSLLDVDYHYLKCGKPNSDLLLLEYLPGPEYTVDCFTNHRGELLYSGARERKRIKSGISANTRGVGESTDLYVRIRSMACAINDNIDLNGAWFFQIKLDRHNELTLLEIAPRVGGSSGLARIKGVNLPALSYYNHIGKSPVLLPNDFEVELDRALNNKYRLSIDYDHVYMDFDDCLYCNNQINGDMVKLIVQCRNANKVVHLLTKYAGNIEDKLSRLGIRDLLDEVKQIPVEGKKAKYINHKCSIFIDDSFAERGDVKTVLNIPVFAPDAIEGLLK